MDKSEQLRKLRDYVKQENIRLGFCDAAEIDFYPERSISDAICAEDTWTGKMAEEQAEATSVDMRGLINKFMNLHDILKTQAPSN